MTYAHVNITSLFTAETDQLNNKLSQQTREKINLAHMEFTADMVDLSTKKTGERDKDISQAQKTESYNIERGASKTTVVILNDNDDDSGDDDDDDDDDDNRNDDADDHDHNAHDHSDDEDDVKKFKTSIDFKPRYDERNTDEKERHDVGTFKRKEDIWSKPSLTSKETDSPHYLKWFVDNARQQKALQTQTAAFERKNVLPNLLTTIPEINEDHIRLTSKKFVNNVRKKPNGTADRTLNHTELDLPTGPLVFKPEHVTSKQSETHRTLPFQPIKPMPPPVAFTKTFIPKTRLLSLVLNDTVDDMGYYSKLSICPVLEIRRPKKWSGNVNCTPRQFSASSCIKAAKEYDLSSEPLKCANESSQQLCSFKMSSQLSNQAKTTVKCETSTCGTNPVYVLQLSPVFGILEERLLWKRFLTSEELEKYLESYANASSAHGFNFCILICVRKETTGFIEQLFTFPSLHKFSENTSHDDINFNLNILVLDSVSRPHFYRSLPKTVETLREIVHFDLYNATVLDFEMLQSTAAYTFHNVRALMSGKKDFHYSGGHINESYGIDVLFGKFKKLGYYTLLQEDSCWYDSWGSLFTDNKYQGNTPREKAEFARRWRKFRKIVKQYNIDDFGLSHASCEVLKRYNTTNQFNNPRKVCFGGKAFAEHFLDYSEGIYDNLKDTGKVTRVLSYTHLNTGHEITGTRIRQTDDRLSRYIEKMATIEDTLTVVLSDHGPKTTKYSFRTMEGKAEKYDPFLFFIIPERVARTLGMETIRALVQNQKRLITTLDLHKAFMSLGKPGLTNSTGIKSALHNRGIFCLIPANRTCADLSMKPLAVCKCAGWEKRFPDNDKRFTWLAEFALGNINNNIQEQYLRGRRGKEIKGYGNCQRLAGKRFSKIRQRTEGGMILTNMDITVTPGNEIFEVQIKHSESSDKKTSFVKMTQRERITIYRHFRNCADSAVSLGLCVCDSRNFHKGPTKQTRRKWVTILRRQDILDVISLSRSFGAETKLKDVHDGCLLLTYRNHAGRSTSFEISNTCNDRTYSVTISVTNAQQYLVSRRTPFTVLAQQRTIHFLLVVRRSENSNHNFKLKVSHRINYVKN